MALTSGAVHKPGVLVRFTLAALLVLTAGACKHNKRANTIVTQRASFDFPCHQSELTLTTLDTEGARKLASQIAVHGCDKKAVYVYYPNTNTWMLNGTVAPYADAHGGVQPPAKKGKARSKRKDKTSGGEVEAPDASDAAEPDPG